MRTKLVTAALAGTLALTGVALVAPGSSVALLLPSAHAVVLSHLAHGTGPVRPSNGRGFMHDGKGTFEHDGSRTSR